MFGYKIDIWNSVKHNGEYNHVLQRYVIVHLEEKVVGTAGRIAKTVASLAGIVLKPSSHAHSHDDLVIDTSGEYVYDVTFLGTAISRTVWEYHKEKV